MNLFGTDGIRKKVGLYPFTADTLPRVGTAVAQWALEKYGEKTTFLIASDTRYSCSYIKAALFTGMLRLPIKVYYMGILPTPSIFHLMQEEDRFTSGIMISASHNPAEDNGIKIVDSLTGKLTREDEEKISFLIQAQKEQSDYHFLGTSEYLFTAEERYIEKIISHFKPNFLAGQKIVLDCAHGATYRVAPTIFTRLGAEIIVINDKPDGYNINKECGAIHLESLQKAVLENNALMGAAFDGDGDRFIAVNNKGLIKDGDDLLALLLEHNDYKHLPAVVGTIISNQGLEAHLASQDKKLIRTSVGDKNVLEALNKEGLTLGGESSGHTILASTIPTGDGILVALKTLETMLTTGNLEMRSFTKYPQTFINVPVKTKRDLTEAPLADYIQQSKDLLPSGRLLVRYSGTEPLLRVMVEDKDSSHSKQVATKLADQLKQILS